MDGNGRILNWEKKEEEKTLRGLLRQYSTIKKGVDRSEIHRRCGLASPTSNHHGACEVHEPYGIEGKSSGGITLPADRGRG